MTPPGKLGACLLGLAAFVAPSARAEPAPAGAASVAADGAVPETLRPYPHLKLSYRHFAISDLDTGEVALNGLELDAYPVSTQWVRTGFELEGGKGHAEVSGYGVDVKYGVLGLSLGIQYGAPVTPFVEARAFGGILSGEPDRALMMVASTTPALSAARAAATTWIYGRGLDAGAEIFLVGHVYVTVSVGWLRTTWGGIDYQAALQDPQARPRPKNLTDDSFTFKLGVGI